MEQTRIIDADHGPRLIIEEGQDETGAWVTREIDLIHLTAMSELLGVHDLSEVIAAIRHINERNEDEPDGMFDDAFTLLTHREREREKEAQKAKDEGKRDDPRSPALRSAMAARRAVHEPIDGGECVMDRCRRKVREGVGLADPVRKAGAASRVSTPAADGECRELLAPRVDELKRLRNDFLHQLTDNSGDPLAADEPAQSAEPVDPVQAAFAKYGGAV